MLILLIIYCTILVVRASIPPIIDISAFYLTKNDENYSLEEILRTSSEIDRVLQKYGVFIATGHNLSSDLLDKNQKAMHELFQLSKQNKESVSLKATTAFGRGYLGFGEESGLSEYFEPKEGFSYGFPGNTVETGPNELQSQNFWPSNLSEESRKILSEVYLAKVSVAQLLIRGLSVYFNARSTFPNDYLETLTSAGHEISLMRLFHYYNVNDDIVQRKIRQYEEASKHPDDSASQSDQVKKLQIIGSSPHTDWGLLTLILQDNVGGLQFYHQDEWHGVAPTAGGIIVNGGDYLSMITNYRYHSPIHRVLSPDNRDNSDVCDADSQECSDSETYCQLQERYSMVFFYYPNYDSTISANQNAEYKFTEQLSELEDSPAKVKDHKDKRDDKDTLNYNTLEFTGAVKDSNRFDESAVVMFGDYIIRKWKGVSRA